MTIDEHLRMRGDGVELGVDTVGALVRQRQSAAVASNAIELRAEHCFERVGNVDRLVARLRILFAADLPDAVERRAGLGGDGRRERGDHAATQCDLESATGFAQPRDDGHLGSRVHAIL